MSNIVLSVLYIVFYPVVFPMFLFCYCVHFCSTQVQALVISVVFSSTLYRLQDFFLITVNLYLVLLALDNYVCCEIPVYSILESQFPLFGQYWFFPGNLLIDFFRHLLLPADV